LVRDVYVAEGLWPQAQASVDFYLPGPSGAPLPAPDPARRHYRQLNLSAHFEALSPGPEGMALPGLVDQIPALQSVLKRAGLETVSFRGWRCEMAYPVPLIEMRITLRLS
jgi:hypothetical protein